jgi:hypothetical protein
MFHISAARVTLSLLSAAVCSPFSISFDSLLFFLCHCRTFYLHLLILLNQLQKCWDFATLAEGLATCQPANMCYQIVERYSVCRCLYHRHSVDPCRAYGQRGHPVTEKTVLVGFACSRHSVRRGTTEQSSSQSGSQSRWRDSGYSSGGGAFQSSSAQRR